MNLPLMISYAQNFEDVLLRRALHDVKNGFYVDCGAQDPKLDSVTKHFYDAGWRGINIEPHPKYFAALQRERPRDINVSKALSSAPGVAAFYFVDDSGLSSLDQRTLSLASTHKLKSYSAQVELVRLDSILDKHGVQDIHFLKVDVEGAERDVLEGANLKRYRPWIVVVEATLPADPTPCWEQFEPVMLASDYVPVLFDGLNRWYVRTESVHLSERFKLPVNIFDNFLRWREAEWERQRAQQAASPPKVTFAATFGR
jgi:heptosyltransferase II